jgi:Raf kinase inhibitor-like YbhB/YbcL family protein
MKRNVLIIIAVLIIIIVGIYLLFPKKSNPPEVKKPTITTTVFSLSSPVFEQNGLMPKEYTCDGANISPPLSINNVPADTMSMLLLIDDIDTPQATWVHWLLWNIPSTTKEIGANSVPVGSVVGLNSFGNNTYGGPCPSSGRHRYVFRLYALDTLMTIDKKSHKQDAIDAANTHILGEAELTGIYSH